jgi:cyclophilin family peptidyl-prolyl cis-trans isomerase
MKKELMMGGGILVAFVIILFALTKVEEKRTMPRAVGTPTPQQNITSSPQQGNNETVNPSNDTMKKQKMEIDPNKTYSAVMKTEAGTMTIELNAKQTPITVNNFVTLARKGFYNGTPFHRIIKGFMIQGGDPTGTGRGGPGYQFDDEPFEGEYTRGTIAMANAGPDTNGSQFFIMHADYALPKNYIIFGKVTEGLETIDTIATAETKPGGEGSAPVTPVKIESVEIIER